MKRLVAATLFSCLGLGCSPSGDSESVTLGTTLADTFGKAGSSEKATGVAPGSVVVAATVSDKIVVRKYDFVGQTWFLLWTATVAAESATVYRSGKPATDTAGNIYVPGQAGSDAVLVKLTSGGGVDWIRTVSGAAFESCAVEPAGTIAVVGTQGGDIVVVRFDASGTQLGSATYASAGNDEAADIAVDPSGRIFVTGAVGSPLDVVLLGYTSSLTALWAAKTFDGGLNGIDRGTAVAVDGTSAVYVASERSLGGSDTEWGIQKIDPATGSEVWSVRTNPTGGADRPNALIVSGDLFCAGTLAAGSVYPGHDSGTDMGVVRYHSDGHLLWSNSFSSGKGDDAATGLLISNGRLVVVGYVGSGAGDPDGYVGEMALEGTSSGSGAARSFGGLGSGDFLQATGGVAQIISGSKAFLGNVGIGTSTPSYKLDVAGQIRSSSGGFVFPDGTTQTTAASGSGTVSFASITSGTNTSQTLTVGNGSSLVPSGTGVVRATEFVGSGSTTNAVDLATAEVGGVLPLAGGGTNAGLTASNGGIAYSTSSALAVLSGTATAGRMLQSGASAAPAWSSATWPATTTASQLLYSSATNTVDGLATANNGVLVTNSSGVPSISTDLPTAVTIGSGYVYRAGGTDVAVIDGGTGSSNGSITGTGALTLAAGGSNQNVTLTPSGTGAVSVGGQLQAVLGSAATPAYSFTGDSDTGMFSPGANSIQFAAGGAIQLTITTTNINSGQAFRVPDGSAGSPSVTFTNDTDTGIWRGGTNILSFSTAASERVRIDASGNVGIGTTSPGSRLHLAAGLTSASWGTAGIQFQAAAATHTDSSAAGTRATGVAVSFAQPTFDASNPGTTITDAATVYIANSPTSGSANLTLTYPWSLWVDAGFSRFDDAVALGRVVNSTLSNGASNHNIDPGSASFLQINSGPTAGFTITGFSGGVDGRILIIHNNTGQNMTLANESGSSSAANQIRTLSGADLVTVGDGSVLLIYSGALSKWIVLASQL